MCVRLGTSHLCQSLTNTVPLTVSTRVQPTASAAQLGALASSAVPRASPVLLELLVTQLVGLLRAIAATASLVSSHQQTEEH